MLLSTNLKHERTTKNVLHHLQGSKVLERETPNNDTREREHERRCRQLYAAQLGLGLE